MKPASEPHVEIERLAFQTKRSSASIMLAIQPEGVVWAAAATNHQGGVSGFAEPLGRWGTARPYHCATDRTAAVLAASERIRRHEPDPEVLAWLDTLVPEQPSLFGDLT